MEQNGSNHDGLGPADTLISHVPRLALITLLAASSLTVMAGATIAPALPAMAQHFAEQSAPGSAEHGRAEFLVRLALTGPGLFTAIVSLLAGPMVDRWGRVRPLIAALAVYLVAGTSGLYVDDLSVLLVGRAFLGAAVGVVMVATTTLIGDLFTGPMRQRVTGWQSACMSFGGVVFLTTAGVLADVSWRLPFGIYCASALVLAGTASGLVGLERARGAWVQAGHGLAGRGAGALAGSHRTVRGSGTSGDGTTQVRWRVIAGLLALGFAGMVLFYMMPTYLPFRLQEMGVTQKKFGGFAIALNGLVAGMIAMQYPRLRRALPFAGVSAVQFGLMGLGYVLISQAESYGLVLAACAVNGLGQGLMLPNVMSWMASVTSAENRGKLTGYLVGCIFLGQFLSPIVAKPLGDEFGLAREFGIAGAVLFGLAGMMGVVGLAAWRRGRGDQEKGRE